MKFIFDFLKNNWIILLLVVIVATSFGYSDYSKRTIPKEEIGISEIAEQVEKGMVEKIEITGNQLKIFFKEKDEKGQSKTETTYKEDGVSLTQYGITPEKVKIDIKNAEAGSIWWGIFSTFVPFLLLAGFLWFIFRQAQGANSQAMSFGKSKARLNIQNVKTTFADVAGSEESKKDLIEVVDFLKNPKKYRDLGAQIPRGVLLIGPPGTGKTLLAKAVAGEAGAPFFSISGSEFVEMFVGVGASRVRDLFAKARRNAPCIIFIDEIDAVGRQRGAGLGGSHDEREQTLNQILVELDGFDTEENVIVMAATNRPDVLDPALLRPGRFDRQVLVDLPDIKEREAILAVHAKGKPLAKDVDLKKLAQKTSGFSGADLKNLLNEGAILAARENKKNIGQADVAEAIEKVMMGPERKSKVISEKEKQITAYHEAGHALVAHFSPHADPVHKISIISRGRALGYTWNPPEQDRVLQSRSEFEDDLAVMLGGREAELLTFKEVTTGAHNDLARVSKLARAMVTEYGMSDKLGPISLNGKDSVVFLGKDLAEAKNYSEKTAQIIDEEISRIIEMAGKAARDILIKNKAILKKLTDELLVKETLEREEFEALMG
ncbi:ATP-dependent zinc metalloprotease FtsH [Candidatus Microgenomates bacterium]|nr:ATP-dependent zinc metalloprotease FtsH [Candidatus Microgenomates bacterium]